ncbi:hypothetical protein BpHYR1_010514 [Brachionus plicatilis]|uniref:Uncharacterized protein n=1 Tax=Brachionus plicatilis TaxID=10195 RepID=A0A3M7TA75_BRAPC|nr:hypothetical protein BpHYR1_010514 [Brachionus plicatilis]
MLQQCLDDSNFSVQIVLRLFVHTKMFSLTKIFCLPKTLNQNFASDPFDLSPFSQKRTASAFNLEEQYLFKNNPIFRALEEQNKSLRGKLKVQQSSTYFVGAQNGLLLLLSLHNEIEFFQKIKLKLSNRDRKNARSHVIKKQYFNSKN